MSEEQKIIDLENEISFLKDALCEKQKEIARLKEIIEQLQKEIEYLQGYTKVIGRVGGKTSE